MKQLIQSTKMLTEARSPQKGLHWGLELLIFLLVFFVAQILQAIPVGISVIAWIFTSSDILNALLQGDMNAYMSAVNDLPDWMMLVQLFSTVLATLTAILFCRLIEKRPISSMGLRRGHILREYAVGLVIGTVMISLCVGLCALFGGLTLTHSKFSLVTWLLYLIGFLIQGMSEEVICRGYLMVSVSRKNAMWLAVATNSIVFALLHLANPGIGFLPLLNIALFGVFESVYVLKRGNLWGACAIHSFWNFFQGNVFGVSVSGTGAGTSPLIASMTESVEWLNGGSFGIEGGVIVTAVVTVAILLTVFFVPSNKEELIQTE